MTPYLVMMTPGHALIALQGNLLDTGRHPTRASGVEVTKSRLYRETRME